jgi:hypothetical protein
MRTVSWMAGVILVAALPAVVFTACDRKIPQCNRLIKVINGEQSAVRDSPATDPASLRKLADSLEDVSKKVAAVELDDPKLVEIRNQYAAMTDAIAAAARNTAKALEEDDLGAAEKSNKELETVGKQEAPLVADLNGYCSGGD